MKRNNIRNSLYLLLFVTLAVAFSSCKKFLQIPPPSNQVISSTVFTNDAIATSAVVGIYSEMMNSLNQFCNSSTTFYGGLSADELYYYFTGNLDEFTKNQITQANHTTITSIFWSPCYKYIYAANLAIEQLNKSTGLSVAVKNTLLGESKFIRAFCYFYLVNLFGDVPLTTTSDYTYNSNLPRTSQSLIYSQIINDLKDAQSLLSNNYPTADRVRPNKWAATALLARVYLYNKDWNNAEAQSTMVISSGTYSLPTDLTKVFLKASTEAIWQLLPVRPNFNTYEGNVILPASSSTSPSYLLTNTLLGAFEIGDQRRISWVSSRTYSSQTLYYPSKYKVRTSSTLSEYYMVLRLAEQYLIRAEARVQQNNIAGTQSDLNTIRNRAGLPNTTANTQATLLLAIEQEKRIELFAEWGHRWFDLKRTNRADPILGALKPATWQPTDVLWPIPQDQINLNPSLTQNPGY